MIEVKGLTRQVFEVVYAALNATKPKGEEFYENAAFRKLVKEKLGVNTTKTGPDMDKLPEEGIALVMEDSTFRYVEKTVKWASESGEVFIGSGSEWVAETLDVLKAAKKPDLSEVKKSIPAGV